MTVQLNPYLNFRTEARAAIEFYHSVFGGSVQISTFASFGAPVDEDEQDLVMHSELVTDDGFTLMAADTPKHMDYQPGGGFSVSLSGDDEAKLRGFWDKLAAGGNVTMPLDRAPWGDYFGMCHDKFGVSWLVNIAGQPAG